jgi:hypothetical protein
MSARLDRIEELLAETASIAKANETRLTTMLGAMAGMLQAQEHVLGAMAGMLQAQEHVQQAVLTLTQTVSDYVTAADKRMAHLEQQMVELIRVITAEHSNGRKGGGELKP